MQVAVPAKSSPGFAMKTPASTFGARYDCLRAFTAGTLLLCAHAAFGSDFPLPPRGDAIEKPATSPMAGIWIGKAQAPDRSYKILLYLRAGAPMYDGTVNYDLNCVILEPPGLEDSYCKSASLDGNATTLNAGMVGEYGESQKGLFWASSATGELSLSLGGSATLSGTWTESSVSFTRLVPRIARAEAAPVTIEDLQYHWRNFRENGGAWKGYQFGSFRVMLIGADLPNVNFGVGEIVVDDPHFELYRASVVEEGKLQIDYRLHEGVRGGKKRLTLAGGATVEFDLVIVGQEEDPVALRFVREDSGDYTALSALTYADSFFVEAEFADPPEESVRVANLEWDGGARDVTLLRTADNPLIYRSDRIRLRRPMIVENVQP